MLKEPKQSNTAAPTGGPAGLIFDVTFIILSGLQAAVDNDGQQQHLSSWSEDPGTNSAWYFCQKGADVARRYRRSGNIIVINAKMMAVWGKVSPVQAPNDLMTPKHSPVAFPPPSQSSRVPHPGTDQLF